MTTPRSVAQRLVDLFRRHPVMSSTVVACMLLGAVLGGGWLPQEWSLARRVVAGALAGAGTGMLMTGTKWVG